jgi:hypothetical protein
MSSASPESTIYSADRRSFIKKVGFVTAAAGVGGVLAGQHLGILPESSAASSKRKGKRLHPSTTADVTTCQCCNLNAFGNIAIFTGCCQLCIDSPICGHEITGVLPARVQGCGAFYTCGANLGGSVPGGIYCSCCCCLHPNGRAVLNLTNHSTSPYAIGISSVTENVGHPIPSSPVAVFGLADKGAALYGNSVTGIGVKGTSCGPVTADFSNNGNGSDKTAGIQISSGCSVPVVWNAGVGGAGDAHGLTNGQFFLGHCGPKMVLATCGRVGIGTTTPNATLQVNGGVSVGAKIVTKTYPMTSSDFAILVNADAKALKVMLPSAGNTGQVVLVKKIDSSTNKVTLDALSGNSIEGLGTVTLSEQYDSMTLIAGGNGVWYILSNAA